MKDNNLKKTKKNLLWKNLKGNLFFYYF